MTTLVIKTNVSQGTNVTIRDMGIIIPNSGGSLTFTKSDFILVARLSRNLETLATDDAHGAGSSTIILNDGTGDITQANVISFLANLDAFSGDTGIQGITGILGIDGNTGIQGDTGPGSDGFQGLTGILGVAGNQGAIGIEGSTGIIVDTFNSDIAEATGDITTTSSTSNLATSMTLTPAAGTYMVSFTGSVGFTSGGQEGETVLASIWFGNTKVNASERRYGPARDQGGVSPEGGFSCFARVTVNGSQAIEGRWRRLSAGTAEMHQRTLMIIEITD